MFFVAFQRNFSFSLPYGSKVKMTLLSNIFPHLFFFFQKKKKKRRKKKEEEEEEGNSSLSQLDCLNSAERCMKKRIMLKLFI